MSLLGCSSKPKPEPYDIARKNLKTMTTEQGEKLFSFLVTVKAGSKAIVNKKGKLTKKEMKRLFEQDNFVDSAALKMELEEKAALLLDQELIQKDYCPNSYDIEEVLWRDYSVRLSGRCKG